MGYDIRKAVNKIRDDHNIVERKRFDPIFRIERSMVQSLLDVPAIGIEQMRFKFQEDEDLECSFATDGETIFYNPFVVNKMTEQQLNTALCHQTLHFILRHLQRREDRVVERWDDACDEEVKVAINDELKTSKGYYYTVYHFDKNMIKTNHVTGTAAEQIYDLNLLSERRDDIHSLWDLAKMESTKLKDTSAAKFDGSKVLAGETVDIPTDTVGQFQMIEAIAQHIESKTQYTSQEMINVIKFSYNFPTALCVFLLKRTVCAKGTISVISTQKEWVEWVRIYKDYII